MNTPQQYRTYRKPSWAPPSWIFAPVWTVLYIGIATSFGTVALKYLDHLIPLIIALPFILNLISNALYTPLQFGLKNAMLATIDIYVVLGTLIWALVAIYPFAAWIAYVNIPYLLWVCFATVLQTTITIMNWKAA